MRRAIVIAWLLALPLVAHAAPRKHPAPPAKKAPVGKPAAPTSANSTPGKDDKATKSDAKADAKQKAGDKVFDFNGLDISGRLRTPQLLYFLERATEELERASLEHRSFVPEMARSIDEAPL